ncbi:MAG: aldo/keto reductase [FCB group bacterium]|jgi:aryl-alcohol dehydrogenase-like predicted oxidoreductase
MNYKKLGNLGLEVSALGLGCMGMSDFYENSGETESIRTLLRAIDLGLTFFDTADVYGPYKNEILLGKTFKGKRDKVIIATKFGNVRSDDGKIWTVNSRPEYVKSACDASLKRLGIDYIDLYYQHRVDPNTPIEDTVGAMSDLVKEGKVRFLGLSEAKPVSIRKAHAVHPITALQSEYSLWTRDPEDEILSTIRELGIGFVPYSPVGRGFLTGIYKKHEDLPENDYRRYSPRFLPDNFVQNRKLVDRIEEIANAKGVLTSQLALAWVLAQGDDIVPIPGTSKVKHLEENIATLDIKLTTEEMMQIDEVFPKGAASGARYPERAMNAVNR